ncbi:nodulation protein NodH [Thioclava sp. SK-1]|uniref:nodulation protein NodH n=1 Tax=Thioclava sp. SK-1 TaxID=1889770 RepID=UPI0008245414|nr:nodulation protein NodH [Thioclava sp. SK-1]OCX65404.1 nodulation protein NodH [Thioclava sp. SK-1]
MPHFESFVIFAEMRTGSNLLEAAINALPGVTCHGEAFNPALIGYPNRTELLGITLSERDADPTTLWKAIRKAPGLNGCRYFHEHDPRVLALMLKDPKCAKIILTRNPIESYVSLKIARSTNQWKLGDASSRRIAQAEFQASEFEDHLTELQDFQIMLMNALQVSAQTAFYIDYEDAQNIDVLNGLAKWLGVEDGPDALPSSLVVQNPEPLSAKVTNFAQMEASLARMDRFNLSRTPNFEPRRGPNVPGFIGASQGGAGLLYMPLRPALDQPIRTWLEQIGELTENYSQKTLRQWKRQHKGHRSFTVIRHPLMRAHLAFIALLDWPQFDETRRILRNGYKLTLPELAHCSPADYADALHAFILWLKANLNAQTSLPVNHLWASQSTMLHAFSQIAAPDMLIREERLSDDLGYIASCAGVTAPMFSDVTADSGPIPLHDIWSPQLEEAARDAYQRDYMQFGFSQWRA